MLPAGFVNYYSCYYCLLLLLSLSIGFAVAVCSFCRFCCLAIAVTMSLLLSTLLLPANHPKITCQKTPGLIPPATQVGNWPGPAQQYLLLENGEDKGKVV